MSSRILSVAQATQAAPIPESLPEIPLHERSFTGPRGELLPFLRDSLLTNTLHGVTASRVIVFDPEEPAKVVMRMGKNGRYGPLGGQLEPGENPARCAVRECRQEGRLARVPDLTFVTVLVHETRGLWLDRDSWDSWGYSTRGRSVDDDRVWVANIRTAIFAAPLAEGLRSRNVEGRNVTLIDLGNDSHREQVRPMYRHLFDLWKIRQEHSAAIPTRIRYTRA